MLRGVFVIVGVGLLLLKANIRDIVGRPPEIVPVLSATVRSGLPGFLQGTAGSYGMIVVVDPADFGCPPCFQDILQISEDMSRLALDDRRRRGIYLLRQARTGPWSDSASVEQWAEAQGLPFPVRLIPDSIFATLARPKSSIIIVDESMKPVLVEPIPVVRHRRAEIQQLMEKKTHVDDPPSPPALR